MSPRRPPRLATLRAVALVGVLLAGPAAGVAVAKDGSASARGFGALLSTGTVATAEASSDGRPLREAAADAVGGPGIVAGRVEVRVGAGTTGGEALAEGVAQARDVVLLDGRVVVSSLRVAVRARAARTAEEAGLSAYSADGLVVDGQPVGADPGRRVEIGGVGTLVLFEQVVEANGAVRANGLRLEVTDPASGLAPGTQIVVGHVEARAEAGDAPAASPPPAPPPAAPPPASPSPAPAPGRAAPLPADAPGRSPDPGETRPAPQPAPPPPPAVVTPPSTQAQPLPPAVGGGTTTAPSGGYLADPAIAPTPDLGLPRREAPGDLAPGTSAGYVFPVLGEVSFTDDYGAPRAETGWHHGNDVFAPMGAPIVAITDGVLSKVGVNRLGGNRLWLTDDRGNTFYYAHLSAYAPETADGVRVRAGQIIGFVGNTGQAITTPPHLHFEVHPGDGDSTNPYPYLLAWQRGTDVPRAFTAATEARGQVPAAGALLVGVAPERDEPPPGDDGLAEAVR